MFEIVLVCTGNRCRSPVAEACLRTFGGDLPIAVGSAGLLDLDDAPALPEVVEAGRTLGLDLSAHRARPLRDVDLSRADLVLGLERNHVSVAVVEMKVPFEKAFTLIEAVRFLEDVTPPQTDDPEHRARLAVALAHHRRKATKGFVAGLDLPDPFGGRKAGYGEMATRIADLSRRLLAGLFGPDAVRPSGLAG